MVTPLLAATHRLQRRTHGGLTASYSYFQADLEESELLGTEEGDYSYGDHTAGYRYFRADLEGNEILLLSPALWTKSKTPASTQEQCSSRRQ